MKIYTKTGDDGETSLLSGVRVAKSDPRLEAYGTVDELNSVLGICLAKAVDHKNLDGVTEQVKLVQHRLFTIGSLLACDDPTIEMRLPNFKEVWITELEQGIDKMEASLQPLRQFILPGGDEVAAHFHLARTVCRRAERACASLNQVEIGGVKNSIRYLNRLSDYFFVAARFVNLQSGVADTPWSKDVQ